MKTIGTWEAKIYVGLKVRYSKEVWPLSRVYDLCEEFVNEHPWCVTVTPTAYIYTNGHEPGVVIGIIQYPRFPDSVKNLEEKTLKLAEILMVELCQLKVSVVFPDRTVMLES